MALKNILAAYLALEQEMLKSDAVGDAAADTLRDAMDVLWYSLSDEEHRLLDDRTVLYSSNPKWTITDGVFQKPTDLPTPKLIDGPISVDRWEYTAA